jgi:hypothetical protein
MENNSNDNQKRSRPWRARLASLVAAIGVSFGLTNPGVSSANTATYRSDSPAIETRTQKRPGKLVLRRTGQGKVKVADHWSHESHASHESHSSHYSSHS